MVAAFRQAAFGHKSEKRDPEQFELALEDLETAIADPHAWLPTTLTSIARGHMQSDVADLMPWYYAAKV